MKKILLALAIGYGAWHYYLKPAGSPIITNIAEDGSTLSTPVVQNAQPALRPISRSTPAVGSTVASKGFHCDGRQYCSQMRSCEEATYFLRNCPGVKMDGGDGQGTPNGIPCERQWCH